MVFLCIASILAAIALLNLDWAALLAPEASVGVERIAVSVAPHASAGAPVLIDSLVFVGAMFYVGATYRLRFSEWPDGIDRPSGYPIKPTRHFTTWLHYQGWAAVYAIIAMVAMAMVFGLFIAIPGLYEVAKTNIGLPTYIKNLRAEAIEGSLSPLSQYAIASAAIVTLTAYVKKWENSWRRSFQARALIPMNATRYAGVISQNFGKFIPTPKDISDFLTRYNEGHHEVAIYHNELANPVIPQGYLETFPRIEFLQWKITTLATEVPSFGDAITTYKSELDRVGDDVRVLRDEISEYKSTIGMFLADIPAPTFKRTVHDKLGIDWREQDDVPLSLYDDILTLRLAEIDKAVAEGAADPTPYAKERIAIGSLLTRLREFGKRCDEIQQGLIQVFVCAALFTARTTPDPLIERPGFSLNSLGYGRIDLGFLIVAMAIPGGIVILATMIYFFVSSVLSFATSTDFQSQIIYTVALIFAPFVGAYMFSVARISEKLASAVEQDMLRCGVVDITMIAATAWSVTVVGALVATFIAQPLNPGIGDAFRETAMWAHVPVVSAVVLAYAAFNRQAQRHPPLSKSIIAVATILSFVGVAFSLFLSKSPDFHVIWTPDEELPLTIFCFFASAILTIGTGIVVNEFDKRGQKDEIRAAESMSTAAA